MMSIFSFSSRAFKFASNWFPIVKMQWAKGDLLHSHIEKHLGYPAALAALRAKWAILVRHLEAAQVAHGDLQHGNILVRGGSIQLVDYRRHVGAGVKGPPRHGNRPPCLPTSRTERARLRPSDPIVFQLSSFIYRWRRWRGMPPCGNVFIPATI